MLDDNDEVVILGGGIVGLATAYYLGEAGVSSTVIEPDSIGSHASGFAWGGLSPLGGAGIPGPVAELALAGATLHAELSKSLPDDTGIDTEYRRRASLSLALSEDEARSLQASVPWKQAQDGYDVAWLDANSAKGVEPRITDEALGAVFIEGGAEVEPYKFVLALAQAAEKRGATIRHGRATGLIRDGQRVTGVRFEDGQMGCDRLVVAMGPWSAQASPWLGVKIEVRPLKGQILRLRAPGDPFEVSLGWSIHYANTKQDGLLWTGTTEEEAGFDDSPSLEGRDSVMASLLKMVPSLRDAELAQHTACLRPLAADGLPLLGAVSNLEGVYVATGAGRKGILLGPVMGRVTADLVLGHKASIPIDSLGPDRFGA